MTGYGGWNCTITSGAQGTLLHVPGAQGACSAGKQLSGKGGHSGSFLGPGFLGGFREATGASSTQSQPPAPARRRDRQKSSPFLALCLGNCVQQFQRTVKLPSRGNVPIKSLTKLLFVSILPNILWVRCPFEHLIKTSGSLVGK